MSLKIVGVVFLAGLVAQSCAFVVKSLKEDSMPGFVFEMGELSMSATKGELMWIPLIESKGSQSFTSSDVSACTSEIVLLRGFGASYEDMPATVGDDSTNDMAMLGYFGHNQFNMSITAVWDGEQCRADVKVRPLQTEVEPILDTENEMAEKFEEPAVKAELGRTLSEALKNAMETYASKLVAELIGDKIDDSFCNKLKTATKDNYPQIPLIRRF